MRRFCLTAGMCMLALLSACSEWPPASHGGDAAPGRMPAPVFSPDRPHERSAYEAASQRFACETARLDAVRRVSAERKLLTGQVQAATEFSARVAREISSVALIPDARSDMDTLSSRVTALSRELMPKGQAPKECPR